jgi:molybdate transport system regulatory protein
MEEQAFTTNGKIWLEINHVKVLGPGRVELLKRIYMSGSIRQAALQMKMSYKQAWELIKSMNAHFDEPLVISHRGGKGGGNAKVTQNAHDLMGQYHELQQKFNNFLKENVVSNVQLHRNDSKHG